MNILKDKFSAEISTLIENEAKAHEKRKSGFIYSDDLTSFAVSLHFYRVAVRKLLHLPYSESIRKWASPLKVQTGFLSASIFFLHSKSWGDQHMNDIIIMPHVRCNEHQERTHLWRHTTELCWLRKPWPSTDRCRWYACHIGPRVVSNNPFHICDW